MYIIPELNQHRTQAEHRYEDMNYGMNFNFKFLMNFMYLNLVYGCNLCKIRLLTSSSYILKLREKKN